MAAKLVVTSPKWNYYTAKGGSLEAVWKHIVKNGPKDNGTNVAALTTTTVRFDPDRVRVQPDGRIRQDRRTGWYTATCKIKTLDVTMDTTIEAPRVSGPDLGIFAYAEWVRFLAAVYKHEEEHVEKAKREMATVISEMNRLRGEGYAETERDAAQAAQEDLVTRLYDGFMGKLDARLEKIHAKFDKATGHGPTLDLRVGA